MGEWVDHALGEVLTLQRGFDLPKRLRRPGLHPVVSSAGVTGLHDEFKVDPPGVVIGRYGSLGSVHWIDEPFWPLNTALWVKDFKGNDARFLSYLLRTVAVDGSTASAVPGVNRNHLHKVLVSVPDVPTQKRIAAVLSAFDELIEINERRIELLEDLARSLYREWFVHFRFPGHEGIKMVESELGRIPAGWEVGAVGEVFNVLGGGTPSKKCVDYWDGGQIPWFTPSDLTRARRRFAVHSSTRITDLGLDKSAARLFPPESVLMTSRATLGVLAIAAVSGACNQGFIAIPPKPGMPSEFVLEWLRSKAGELNQIATGATFKEITKGAFKRFPVMVPEPRVLKEFASRVLPFSQMIMKLEALNSKFAATRDLLLPRLVSGQLDISDIDLGVLTPAETE